MRLGTAVLLAVLAALWLTGLVSQLHSAETAIRYLALSLVPVAAALWDWQPARPARRRFRDRRRPPST